MPYLKQNDRKEFNPLLSILDSIFCRLRNKHKLTAGVLNFLFTRIAHSYINTVGESYQNYNDIVGALEGAKLELYRRRIANYENVKKEENGDV